MKFSRAECQRIVMDVARRHGLFRREIVGPRHWPEYVEARREIAQRLRNRGVSLVEIGAIMNRHHATVINLLRGKRRYEHR